MPANILIIDDKNVPHDLVLHPWGKDMNQPINWSRHITASGNHFTLVAGRSYRELVADLERVIALNQGQPFDGTILDVIFSKEPHGGISLWDEIIAKGLRPMMGALMISTNANYNEDQFLIDFANRHAEGRISGDKNESAMRHLCDFLKCIPKAVQCV